MLNVKITREWHETVTVPDRDSPIKLAEKAKVF